MTLIENIRVDFNLKISKKIELFGVKYWRCGLLAVGIKNVFVAVNDVIRVYEKSPFFDFCENVFYHLKCQVDSHAIIHGEIDIETPLSFNSIKIGYLGDEEVLVCCTDSGYINVWFTNDLLRSPLIFNTEKSAWGIAIHASKRLLAISSNEHNISLWSLSVYNPFKVWDTDMKEWPHKFCGHDDNIPSICFNKDGTLLMSAGIDGTCRLWDVVSGTLLYVYSDSQRGWFVGFIDILAFKVIKNIDFSEKYLKSIPNHVIMTLSKDHINDRNASFLMDNSSDSNSEEQEGVDHMNNVWDMQGTFLTGLDIQELFRNHFIGQNVSISLSPIKHEESLFSFYTSIEHDELVFYGTEKDINLCNIKDTVSRIQLLAECRNLFDNSDILQTGISRYMDRINMVEFIPDLSLCIVASQKGKACLMHLVKSVMDCTDGSTLSSYTMIVDQIFPRDPPSCGLLGITVEKVYSRCYKLYMLYYDGTIMLYEIKKPIFDTIDVDELVL
ncbi:hypothetical protein PCANB_000500 [Pneumocystis canis]|nr:hypothetical protein PCK1_000473 [Pneumocystis canis]KAG5437786.1 hypothetical protein PCANB_000500 [Pneumocystis canis]